MARLFPQQLFLVARWGLSSASNRRGAGHAFRFLEGNEKLIFSRPIDRLISAATQ
jgi:hypothetical protein